MVVELSQNPTYIDVVRLWVETRNETGLADPVRISELSIYKGGNKLYDFGESPWTPEGGLLTRDSEGRFYVDFNPYRNGIREAGHYILRWKYSYSNASYRRDLNFSLAEPASIDLPKEVDQELRVGDTVRLRFSIFDRDGNFVDPEIIDRLVVYQLPFGTNKEGMDTRVSFVYDGGNSQYAWTLSSFQAGSDLDIHRESEGQFYFDWSTDISFLSPGRSIAVIYYRLPPTLSLLRGNSWETETLELYFSPSRRIDLIDEQSFNRMYRQWIPSYYWNQPPSGSYPAVAPRLLKAFEGAAREVFNWGAAFPEIYEPDKVEVQALPALASNVGWTVRGIRPQSWRDQISRAVDLFSQKGTLSGLEGFVSVAGGSLENVIRYWQVSPRRSWTDYFLINEDILQSYNLETEKTAVLGSGSDPYQFYDLQLRRTLGESDPPSISIRVVRGSRRVRGQNTFFKTWRDERESWLRGKGLLGENEALPIKIRIDVPGYSPLWFSISEIEDERNLVLAERYTGESSSAAGFLLAESDYYQLSPLTDYLSVESNDGTVTRFHWRVDSDVLLSLGDEIKIHYQTRAMTDEEAEVESQILDLPLADQRDEREIEYPVKNFNARLLEDPDGIWYRQAISNQLISDETHEEFDGGSLDVDSSPLSWSNLIPKGILSDLASRFPTCPSPDITDLPDFQSVLGYFNIIGETCPYFFSVSSQGGVLEDGSWVSRSGSGVTAIELTETKLVFSGTVNLERVVLYYHSVSGRFSPRDLPYLTALRDRICPLGIPAADPVSFGYERTTFPYSEKVYNMDEYNGSLRPSGDPCSISKDFQDLCDCSPTTWLSLTIRSRDLSDDTIREFESIVKEAKPFHAQVRDISFVGDFSDDILITEDIEMVIRAGLEEEMLWVREEMSRSGTYPRNRGEYVFLESLYSGSGTLVDPARIFYSSSCDFISAPVNDPNGLLLVTSGDIGEYTVANVELHQFDVTGGTDPSPTPFSPQLFSIYNPISLSEVELVEEGNLLGSHILGVSIYSAALLGASAEGASGLTYIQVSGIDLISAFDLVVGDYIRIPGDDEFYEIVRFEQDDSGRYSIVVIEGEKDDISLVSFWRNPIHDKIGEFQETYNSLTASSLPSSLDPDTRYLLSLGTAERQSGEPLVGPAQDAVRMTTSMSPIIVSDLFDFTGGDMPLGYMGSLASPYSSYGQFVIGGSPYYFVTHGRGGSVGVDSDVYPSQTNVTEIILTEKGPEFHFNSTAPDEVKIWYHWRDGLFCSVSDLEADPDNPGQYIISFEGLNANTSSIVDYELYKMIPTGVMYNPRRYAGGLPPPYSSYGSFEEGGSRYYFVTKEEGGEVGIRSDVSPSGSSVTRIELDSSTVNFTPSSGITLQAYELAPFRSRMEVSSENLLVKIIPTYPYFINVDDVNTIQNSYFRNPLGSGIDILTLELSEQLSVEITEGGQSRTKRLI